MHGARHPADRGDAPQRRQLHLALRPLQVADDARDVAGPHHGHHRLAGGVPDLLGQVQVALGDERLVGAGEGAGEVLHHLAQHVLLLELLDVRLADARADDDPREQLPGHAQLVVPAQRAPRAAQGDAQLAVRQHQLRPRLLRGVHRLQQLRAGPHAQLLAQPALERGHDQVREQQGGLLAADHLHHVQLAEGLAVGQGPLARRVQLHADGVGPLAAITARTSSTLRAEMWAVPST